jgi:hypothetical protein
LLLYLYHISAKITFLIDQKKFIFERRNEMRILKRWILVIFLLCFISACNPFQEIREAREAAERSNKEAKMILESVKTYAEKAEAAAQRAEKAAALSEDFSIKAEAASQKAVGTFEKRLKK